MDTETETGAIKGIWNLDRFGLSEVSSSPFHPSLLSWVLYVQSYGAFTSPLIFSTLCSGERRERKNKWRDASVLYCTLAFYVFTFSFSFFLLGINACLTNTLPTDTLYYLPATFVSYSIHSFERKRIHRYSGTILQ